MDKYKFMGAVQEVLDKCETKEEIEYRTKEMMRILIQSKIVSASCIKPTCLID